MKTTITIFVLLHIFVSSFCQDIILKIDYQKNEDNVIWTKGIDEITIRYNGVIIKKYLTDTNGIVRIPKSLLLKADNYDISLTSIGIQENYLTSINHDVKDTVLVMLPKIYKFKFGYAICPKCNKSNKVCKISTEPILVRTIVKGDTLYSPIHKRTYYIGTDVWHEFNPIWYCKHDSIKF